MNLQLQPPDRLLDTSFEHRLGRSVSIEQAAILLGVCRRTIYNRIRDGSLQTVRTLGTSQRVLVSSIDECRKVVWGGPARQSQPLKGTNVVPFESRPIPF